MKPIIKITKMGPTAGLVLCALCCSSISEGDQVFSLKTGIGKSDILCSAECARAAADSIGEVTV